MAMMRKMFFTACRRMHELPTLGKQKVAIVGGGPGGLTLARLLQKHGANVKVYEARQRDAERFEAAVDLEIEGLAAIEHAGLTETFQENCRPNATAMRVMNSHLDTLADDDAQEFKEDPDSAEIEDPDRSIDMNKFQDLLLDSLQPGTVVWNSQVRALEPDGKQWKLEFENGTAALGDVVIGADGANSKIRHYVTDQKPFFTGLVMVQGIVANSETLTPRLHKLLRGRKILVISSELTLTVKSRGDGSLLFELGLKTDENWVQECGIDFSDRKQVLEWFKEKCGEWDSTWGELIINATLPLIPRPQYCMPLEQSWISKPSITLLGDAAHVMPPYVGLGVNMAVVDAFDLFLSIRQETSIPLAISNYEAEMREKSSATSRQSLLSASALHAKNAALFVLNCLDKEDGQAGNQDDKDDSMIDEALETDQRDNDEEPPPVGPQIRTS
jgi:2-polyprenyl-6-methoxyphenol hydroxylase-like FAD-dependent oxidoreductase